jgi:MSHA biogenesis protein MshN
VSVINKMLQDLDARQKEARSGADLYMKPVASSYRRVPPLVVAGAAAGMAVIAFCGAFAWRYWHQKAQQPASVPVPAKVVIMPAPPKITALPPTPAVQAPAAESAAPVPPSAPVEPIAESNPEVAAVPEHVTHKRKDTHDTAKKRSATRDEPEKRGAAHDRHAPKVKAATEAPVVKATGQGKEETPSQKAEAAYRRGLLNLQEGYVSDAIAALDQALQANPHHDAARQTLVRILIDNKRFDEAARQLQLALTLDPRQPSMAMLLARLQIEHGGTGIDTLMRTLPFAGGNGEYHAFLAGALQRQQRHREAAEQYQVALRSLPQNGVWLMGLGISLQAEKRDAEALDAFRKAKASGTLTPELLSFVDSKIVQLSR